MRAYRDPSQMRYLPTCFCFHLAGECSFQLDKGRASRGGRLGWCQEANSAACLLEWAAGMGTCRRVLRAPRDVMGPQNHCAGPRHHTGYQASVGQLVWYQVMDNRGATTNTRPHGPLQLPKQRCRSCSAVCFLPRGRWPPAPRSDWVFGSESRVRTSLQVLVEPNFEITQVDFHCGPLRVFRSLFSPSVSGI